ncbi:MAG: RidA family protein [Tunicatimonas sp.]|uniref:RidA family protein n=1 Tax=Tunicatimonas sp. TaxID=1940096 RepID=UPI003C75165D
MTNVEKRIQELGLQLPPAPPAGGVYKPVIIVDKMLYVSGQGPVRSDQSLIKGKLGLDLNAEEGYQAARQVGLTMLSTIKDQLGELSTLKRLVKTVGMVNSQPDFYEHPRVINGFSDLMVEILGNDLGKGARSAVGMILPGNIAVEVEAIFELY